MERFLNIGLAKISVVLTIILSVIYLLRIMTSKGNKNSKVLKVFAKTNFALRKVHKPLGIVLVIIGFVHGLYSSESVFSLNLGTIAWVFSILLGLNWMFRRKMKNPGWMWYHRILTVFFIITIFLHIVDVKYIGLRQEKNFSNENKLEVNTSKEIGKQENKAVVYKDGEYITEANGYRPGLKVKTVIKDGKIDSIEIVSHNEVNSRIYKRAMDTVPNEIIDSQSTDVDTVSGATRTSNGIKNAVDKALQEATK